MKREERTCLICGRIYTAYPSVVAKYCSRTCGQEGFRRTHAMHRMSLPVRTCSICGAEYTCYPSQARDYCSATCRERERNRQQNEETTMLVSRFWDQVDTDGPTVREELGPCWIWTGPMIGPYGGFQGTTAHRFILNLLYDEPLPRCIKACHACDTPLCVRLDHLFPGTQAMNLHDMVQKGRSARGERNGMHHSHGRTNRGDAKLTDTQVRAIRQRYAVGERLVDIVGDYPIRLRALHNVAARVTYRDVT